MALLTVLTDRECLLTIVTGSAEFSRLEGLHRYGVPPVVTSPLFLEHNIMTVGTTQTR